MTIKLNIDFGLQGQMKEHQAVTTSKHNFALNRYLDINVEKLAKPMPACRRYVPLKNSSE